MKIKDVKIAIENGKGMVMFPGALRPKIISDTEAMLFMAVQEELHERQVKAYRKKEQGKKES